MSKNQISPGSKASDVRYHIVVLKNGPYLVYGQPPLKLQFICNNGDGNSWTYAEGADYPLEEHAALCRYGASNTSRSATATTQQRVFFEKSMT